MKNVLTTLLISLILPALTRAQEKKSVHDSLTDRVLSRQQMREDFRYLRKALEKVHPGLYRYTARPDMDRRLDSFDQQLTGDLPWYDYYRFLSSMVAGIRCAHTPILPGKDWETHFTQNAPLFPFSIHGTGGKTYVTANLTRDTSLRPGYELLSINGQSIDDINRFFFAHTWSDGYNLTNKQQRLNTGFFGMYYYLLVARPDSFDITARNFSGQPVRVKYPALTILEGRDNLRRNPVNKDIIRLYVDKKKEDLQLEYKPEINTAVLTIRSFGGKTVTRLATFLPKAMKELEKKKTGHLVIDLRSNGGGWDSAGVFLFTYLLQQPARYYIRQHTISDSSEYLKFSDLSPEDLKNIRQELVPERDGTFSIRPQYAAGLPLQYPKPHHYTGKVYFLMNGGSASTTAELLAAARTHQLGTFIGEEAGGCYEGGNGGSFITLFLPHSGIRVNMPLIYYDNVTKAPFEKGHGVLPDHAVPDNIDNILKGIDTQKEFAFDLIRRGQ